MPFLEVRLPLPPSVNKLYFVKGGRKILSSDGRALKEQMRAIVSKAVALNATSVENRKLRVSLTFFFPLVENKGWSQGKSKSRYKKVDVSNRIKLVEDALFSAIGVDDSQVFELLVRKEQGEEGVHCVLEVL